MDEDKAGGPRLIRSSSLVESGSVGSVCPRWKPTSEQKQVLESMYMKGIRNPSLDQINEIATELQRYGKVEGKNVFYWFQNYNAREKRKKERQSQAKPSKWPALFRAEKWPSLFRSKPKSNQEEEEVDSGMRRNSSVETSEIRTLELFPLRPDGGGHKHSN